MFDRDADWAAIPHLGAAIGVFTPHAWMAIDQLRRVVDVAQVGTFLLNRGCEHGAWGEKWWYEIALIDSGRLILWFVREGHCAGHDERPPHATVSVTLRTIPLSEITDKSLKVDYDVAPDGAVTMTTVDLTLYTSTTTRTVKASLEEYRHSIEHFQFSKYSSHGVAQMNRLVDFAHAVSREIR
ncbi:hypothetical protein [Mycobacteroides chelonae]|uniref:hypothetical protein n=1 Tax=Mycobacteroides chelonae TaxID=1774 RepID=UPI000992D61E|nr:hypothetical protein [Mycobacteroides chelonae]